MIAVSRKLMIKVLFNEESNLLKAGLSFSIQPDKIRKFDIFNTFENTHRYLSTTLTQRKLKTK